MVRKQVYLESRHNELLKAEASRTGLTESELIRQAIDRAFDRIAEQRRLDELWSEWDQRADAITDALAHTGGVGVWSREDAHGRRNGNR